MPGVADELLQVAEGRSGETPAAVFVRKALVSVAEALEHDAVEFLPPALDQAVAEFLAPREELGDVHLLKVDADKQLVSGWASVISEHGQPVTDRQGDVIDAEELEQAVHEFMRKHRTAGEMHADLGIGTVVDSIVLTKARQQSLGIDLGREGWYVTVHVTNPETWEKVKKGELTAFSLGGSGVRVPLDKVAFDESKHPRADDGKFSSAEHKVGRTSHAAMDADALYRTVTLHHVPDDAQRLSLKHALRDLRDAHLHARMAHRDHPGDESALSRARALFARSQKHFMSGKALAAYPQVRAAYGLSAEQFARLHDPGAFEVALQKTFDESKHPRHKGKFTSKDWEHSPDNPSNSWSALMVGTAQRDTKSNRHDSYANRMVRAGGKMYLADDYPHQPKVWTTSEAAAHIAAISQHPHLPFSQKVKELDELSFHARRIAGVHARRKGSVAPYHAKHFNRLGELYMNASNDIPRPK